MTFKLKNYWNPKGSSRTFHLNGIILLIRTLSLREVNGSTRGPPAGQVQVGQDSDPQISMLCPSLPLLHKLFVFFCLPFLVTAFSTKFISTSP